MARIFITGSSDGLGLMSAKILVKMGHQVVLHGRNERRCTEAHKAVPDAKAVLSGDLSSIGETIQLAAEANKLGVFDAIIHNAAIGYREPKRMETADGLCNVFAINSLAPYILTCLMKRPGRLVYISSGLHRSGDDSLKNLNWINRPWSGSQAYSDSKLHNVMLAFAVARKWQGTYCNALEPGWVATKMGGPNAPDSLELGPETQVWLTTSNDQNATVTGKYFYHKALHEHHRSATNIDKQNLLISSYVKFSGVTFPEI